MMMLGKRGREAENDGNNNSEGSERVMEKFSSPSKRMREEESGAGKEEKQGSQTLPGK